MTLGRGLAGVRLPIANSSRTGYRVPREPNCKCRQAIGKRCEVGERLTYEPASKRMESEGRLIFPNGRVQKASIFDRLALSNDIKTTILPTRASFKRNNHHQLHTGKVIGGKDNNIQEPQMIQSTSPTHNSFAPLELVKKNAITAVLQPTIKMNQLEASKMMSRTSREKYF
uniref:Uncharacterized protein n=1 Tax=Ananas comosus var. bracteatus TaxID=296719 RepID=A0A6V7QC47_ANACO|nr:unnamed protein product [Ananas comosus var. bracteatus]